MNPLNLKNLFKVALISSAIASTGSAHAATATGNPSANVLNPISITAVDDLAFGDLTAGLGGTVIIAPNSSRSLDTGTVGLLPGTFTAASFTLAGGINEMYAITLPGSATLSDGGNFMTVDTFTFEQTGTDFSLGATGSEALTIGATLNVGADQTTGAYTGTFDVTVEYN